MTEGIATIDMQHKQKNEEIDCLKKMVQFSSEVNIIFVGSIKREKCKNLLTNAMKTQIVMSIK